MTSAGPGPGTSRVEISGLSADGFRLRLGDEELTVAFAEFPWFRTAAWADSLTIGGASDWRLPATADPDATCSGTGPRGDSCTGSEMGHLFYVELGGDPNSTIVTSGDPTLLALFSNIQANTYWSGTTEAGFADYAWTFTFSLGAQSDAFKTTNFLQAWAVHDGDVSAIPAPGAVWLLGTGLIAVIVKARKRIRVAAEAAPTGVPRRYGLLPPDSSPHLPSSWPTTTR